MAGCTVVDCFKHFTAVEHVENYRCSRCWHVAALKYLSAIREKDEEKFKKLDICINRDSCDCNKIFRQEEVTWTWFSYASKKLSIARCPSILCIHLQRASTNEHGEFIKLQVGSADSLNSSKQSVYQLSSVVEHYGRPRSGHYAVYRRLGSDLGADASLGASKTAKPEWFYVSDREVSVVSEESVLAAEASLLFYEIIDTDSTSDYTAEKAEQAQSQHEHNSQL